MTRRWRKLRDDKLRNLRSLTNGKIKEDELGRVTFLFYFQDINQLSPAVLRLQLQVPWAILFGTLAVLVAGVVAYRYKFL